jgi:hypothetical protein
MILVMMFSSFLETKSLEGVRPCRTGAASSIFLKYSDHELFI